MTFTKRIFAGITSIALALSITPWSIIAQEDGNPEFDEFMQQELIDTLEADYTAMHFDVADYKAMGIEKGEVTIGDLQSYENVITENQKVLDKLHAFDFDTLSESQKVDYREYEFLATAWMDAAKYDDLFMTFEAGSDVTSTIVTNMTEFVLRNTEDVQDYLTVLGTIPGYLEKCIADTQEKAGRGLFITDTQLDQVESWIDSFLSKKEDNALIQVFNENVDAADFLTENEKTSYKEQNQKIILEQILPSYQKTYDELEKLRGSRKYGDSVYDLPNGAEYYQASLAPLVGTTQTAQELLDECTNYLEREIRKLYLLMQTTQDSTEFTELISMNTPEEILSFLNENYDEEFPAVENLEYHAEYLDDSLESSNAVAYYMNCPLDDPNQNSIKINSSHIDDANTLYQTLAHEGITGHMYSRIYYLSTNPNLLRPLMMTLAYGEGWAMYSESTMWNYSGLNQAAADYNNLNTAISYVLAGAVDLGINGLGWTESDVEKYLEKLGLNSSLASSTVYSAQLYPMQFLPYGIGLMKFQNLRLEAEDSLGTDFNAVEFNKLLLDNGPRNFEIIQEEVDAYITAKTGKAPVDESKQPVETQQQPNWLLYGGVGGGIAVIGVIAFVARRKFRKDDPFGA